VLVLWRDGQDKTTDVNFIRATASIFDISDDAHAGIIADDGVPIASSSHEISVKGRKMS
jgi:hypothetical protein